MLICRVFSKVFFIFLKDVIGDFYLPIFLFLVRLLAFFRLLFLVNAFLSHILLLSIEFYAK